MDAVVCNTSRNSSDASGFGQAVRVAVGNVSAAAPAGQGFAVGSAKGSDATVYVLAQCWETLSSARCSACLNAAAAKIVSCSPATEGRALYAGCYMRYSTKLFWNVNQTAPSPTTKGRSNLVWIILGSLLGAFLLITGIVLWIKRDLWIKRNARFLRDLYGPGHTAPISHSNLYYRYDQLKKATNNFGLSNKIGQGSYGTVYKAVLSGGKEVAVKRLFLNTKQWVDQFLNEVHLINRVRHKNLVKLLGCSVDGPESLLVYEYYCNRSLDLLIFDATPDKYLDWQQRFDIIQGVAEGLCYLHEESETRIIHRDIKATNILMDEKFRPKITDFGLARSFSEGQTHLSTGIAGTRGYMAPEYVVHGHLTVKADVYSFGILTLEIVTGKRCNGPPGSHPGQFLLAEIWHHYKSKTLDKIIDVLLSEGVKDEMLHVVQAGLLCTQADPRQRPTMSRVVEFLRSSRRDEELILSDPPFLDITMVGGQEGGAFQLPDHSAADLSTSSWLSGR